MSIGAILATIEYKIKTDVQDDFFRDYVARCLRILTENTAPAASYYSNGVTGGFVQAEYDDIVNPKPVVEYKRGEIANRIRAKMR